MLGSAVDIYHPDNSKQLERLIKTKDLCKNMHRDWYDGRRSRLTVANYYTKFASLGWPIDQIARSYSWPDPCKSLQFLALDKLLKSQYENSHFGRDCKFARMAHRFIRVPQNWNRAKVGNWAIEFDDE